MILQVFISIDNVLGWGRDELLCLGEEEAFKRLWENREELDARFYAMDVNPYKEPNKMYGILSVYDFETDYNDEMLDGGWWVYVLEPDVEFVKSVVDYDRKSDLRDRL